MTALRNLPASYLRISIPRQRLVMVEGDAIQRSYAVSTARNGAGERLGSGCTPRGWHRVRARIGTGQPAGTAFVGRRPTGEIYDATLAARHPGRDWILTRILWLSGLQPGFNRFGEVDSARRYIYIHGSPDHCVTGRPASHGCIRMKSEDVLDLFERVTAQTLIFISENDA
jgi:lipoprotein-anchoring transpeptidase ErfK/SrfK